MITRITTERIWLLEPEAYYQLAAIPFPGTLPESRRSEAEIQVQQSGALATVPIHGTMFRSLPESASRLLNALGVEYTETAKVAKTLQKLETDPSVQVVLLDIDSSGGTVNGTPELANAVRHLSKHKFVYAYSAGLACSAAYWVASQCDGIYAAPSSRVGSVGVILPVVDSKEAYAQKGLHMDVFAAGKYKSTGMSGTSLSEEQRELLQQQVESTWEDFKTAVTRRRRTIAPEHLEGQTFTGTQARDFGLVDACADNLEAVQRKLIARHG